jgi:hypothetical protein
MALSGYNSYQGAGQGLEAAGGATATVLPWVGAGLSAAGLLSQLYGNYKAEQVAEKNYQAQMKEYEDQKALLAEQQRKEDAQRALQNEYTAMTAANGSMDGRLARYQNYFHQVGV